MVHALLKRIKIKVLKLYFELKNYRYYSDIVDNELYILEWHVYYDDRLIYTTKKIKIERTDNGKNT